MQMINHQVFTFEHLLIMPFDKNWATLSFDTFVQLTITNGINLVYLYTSGLFTSK